MEPDKVEQDLKDQIKSFQELKEVADSEVFQKFFDYCIEIVAQKMLWAFTAGKDGDNIKNWDDFCKLRGEVIARLEPIQSVYGAEGIIKALQESLDKFYRQM